MTSPPPTHRPSSLFSPALTIGGASPGPGAAPRAFSRRHTEVMVGRDGDHIIRTPYDFIHVRGLSSPTIDQLLSALDRHRTYDELEAAFPPASEPQVRDLVLRLRRSARASDPASTLVGAAEPPREPEPGPPRRIAVLANGRIGPVLRDHLVAARLGETRLARISLSEDALGRDHTRRMAEAIVLPFEGIEATEALPAGVADQALEDATLEDVAELLGGFDLAICALEDVSYRAFMIVAEAAERARVPTLFVTSGLGNCIVGPLCVPGVTASFADAYRAFFHQSVPEFGDADFLELLRSHPSGAEQASSVSRYVTREIATLCSAWPDSVLLGHLVEVTGGAEASRLAQVLRLRPDGVDASSGRADPWPELRDAAVLRLAITDSACASHRSDRQIPSQTAIRRICVVGGGTAGYLTALTLRRRMPHLQVALLESSKVPIIGVGEATTPSLPALLHGVLGIDVVDFFRTVQPTIKLGIKFEWGGKGPGSYFNYPFGAHGQLLEAQTHEGHILNYSLQSMLMSADKVPIFRTGRGFESRLHLGTTSFAYHIDNKRFVECLHREARRAGVEHIDATIAEVVRDESGGLVSALVTDDGRRLEYDFYVDCSGFRSLLLEQTLGSEWISFGDTLFTDRAIAANVPHGGLIRPYTTAETMNHGWCWRIPTPEDDHRGYVFSSAFCDEEQAVAEMRAKNPGLGEHRLVKFRSGRHRDFWKGNVVAIGNAYAFVEPLESTGIHMIIESILAFIGHFPESVNDEASRSHLNRYIGAYWDDLRWFLGIHFRFNTRLDTPFWRACRAESDVSGLEDCLATLREGAPLSYRNHHLEFDRLWGDHGRDVLLMGQGAPMRLLPPREPREQWMERVRLAEQAVKLAVPQAEALRLLHENPHVLEHLVTDERTWLQSVAGVFQGETAPFLEVRNAKQGRMMRPGSAGRDHNVLLPKSAAG